MSVVAITNNSIGVSSVGDRRAVAPASVRSQPAAKLRLTSRGRRVFGALIAVPLLFSLGAFGLLGISPAAGDETPGQLTYVTVRSGDTLWGIAESITGTSGDIRDTVAEIVSLNDLTSSVVVPGQRIAVPNGN